MRYEDLKNTIFDVEVSAFKNCFDAKSTPINLALWLTSNKYEAKQNELRVITNKKERDKIKIQLPAITPSALLKSREKEISDKLISYSGFMQIDIDFKDNLHLSDYNQLLDKLPHIENIAYCGQSVSGSGYFCLIPITQPNKLPLHFMKINELMKKEYNIKLDTSKGSNITDLRIYSYTSTAYFNIHAKPFSLLYQQKNTLAKTTNYKTSMIDYNKDKFSIVVERLNLKETYIEGNQNNYLVKLAGYCNAKGLSIDETKNGCTQFINEEYTQRRINEIVDCIYFKYKTKHNSHPFK